MYAGHLTYLDKSRVGGIARPIPNERGRLSNKCACVAENDFDA